jgi:hypothetical protein
MRFLRFALCGAVLSIAGLRADDDEKQQQQPEEIPNFNQLDEYIYVPRSTLSLGSRFFLTGPKMTYGGQGQVPATSLPGVDPTIPNIMRTYDDGNVLPDSRTVVDSNGVGSNTSSPIFSDGKTNSWTYNNTSQIQPNGDIEFETNSAEVTDTALHSADGKPSEGLELVMDRDMGKIGKLKWSITGGFSISDIHSSLYAEAPGTLTTLTDTYDLFGQVPPAPPFTSPNTATQSVTPGSASASQTQTVNEAILLGNVPLNRTITETPVLTENRYFIEGAYYTFRIGPTLFLPITKHWTLSVSAGPALIYSGSELNVLEDLTLANGETCSDLYQK